MSANILITGSTAAYLRGVSNIYSNPFRKNSEEFKETDLQIDYQDIDPDLERSFIDNTFYPGPFVEIQKSSIYDNTKYLKVVTSFYTRSYILDICVYNKKDRSSDSLLNTYCSYDKNSFYINYKYNPFTNSLNKLDLVFEQYKLATVAYVLDNTKSKFCVPSLDVLFLLKKSHRYIDNYKLFWKHLYDYNMLKQLGASISNLDLQQILNLREKETYSRKLPKLNMTKNQFFADQNIKYVYDHDFIHEAVAIGDKPAYLSYKKHNEEVMCDKSKWDNIPYQSKINGVLEECYVLSIERALALNPTLNPRKVFSYAYFKVCTTITSGWFREFAYENSTQILKRFDEDFFNKFQAKVASNKIKN